MREVRPYPPRFQHGVRVCLKSKTTGETGRAHLVWFPKKKALSTTLKVVLSLPCTCCPSGKQKLKCPTHHSCRFPPWHLGITPGDRSPSTEHCPALVSCVYQRSRTTEDVCQLLNHSAQGLVGLKRRHNLLLFRNGEGFPGSLVVKNPPSSSSVSEKQTTQSKHWQKT